MRHVLVIGASLAGLRAAQAVRAAGYDGELVMVGAEQRLPYTRPPLSKELLKGEHTIEQCLLRHPDLDLAWRLGTAATGVDRDAKRVVEVAQRVHADEAGAGAGPRARP